MPWSCVPDIDVKDPQALDPIDMDGKCVNPHEAVKEALTTKTAGAQANPTPLVGGTVPRSPDHLGSGNGTHDSSKVSATVCSSVDSVKKVSAKGTSGRAGNEPSYSCSARKKLGSGSAHELNEPSLSLNLGLINLGLGSGSTRKSSARAVGTHPTLERGFRLWSPAGRFWSSPRRSRLRRAGVKFSSHVSRISM